MNVFTTPTFLETAGEVFFPHRKRSIELCRIEGRLLRLLVLDGREVVQAMAYYDFPQPLEGPVPEGPIRELRYFPRTVLHTQPVEERGEGEPVGCQPSPYIDWSRFADYAAFEQMVKERRNGGPIVVHPGSPKPKLTDAERRLKVLQKDLGPALFVYDDLRPEVFDACVKWKSAQYVASGLPDMFANPQNVELFRSLRSRGLLVVSSLSAGEKLLAVHFGAFHEQKLASWIPAYDVAYQKYSPGRMMLHELLRESCQRQHREFDFLIGNEEYKFQFATHNRVIGPLGTPPLGVRLVGEARTRTKALLSRYPRAYALAQSLKRRVVGPG